MRAILSKNLGFDNHKHKGIADIQTLIQQDQVKSVNEKAVEDFWEQDIQKEKANME